MARIFIAAFCAALAAACSAPEIDTHSEGVHLTSADKTSGLTGYYVATNGVRFAFASVVDDAGVVRSTITHDGELALDARVNVEHREMVIGDIDVAEVINEELASGARALDDFRDTPLGIAIMQFPAALKDELGVTDAEILKDYVRNYSLSRMMMEALTGRPLAAEHRVSAETAQAYGCSDTCQGHGSDYYHHRDGTYDDISNDLTSCDYSSGGGGGEPQELEPYGCHGCCGPSCWGCSGIYTAECASHDTCVDNHGHWACLDGNGGQYASLWSAAKSMFR